MKKPFVKPFRIGDVVRIVKQYEVGWGNFSGKAGPIYSQHKLGTEHIIYEPKYYSGVWKYSTDRGAWYPHACFELVRECDAASIRKLMKARQMENE